MNRREEIRKVLNGERMARIPRALYGTGRWAYRRAGLEIGGIVRDPSGFARALAHVYESLDTDIVFGGSGLNTFPAESVGGTLSYDKEQAPLLAFPIIEKTEDARFFDKPDIRNSPQTLALVKMLTALRERLPDRFLFVASWGPFTWGMILCDWNLLKERAITDIPFIQEVCDLGLRHTKAFCEPLADGGLIDGIAVPDGASTLIPLDLYRNIVLPAQKKLFDWARTKGLRTLLHQCGQITPQLALYPESGADCISVDASVHIDEAYDLYHDRCSTAGNVDVINTILGTHPDEILWAVGDCVRRVSDPYRRFILMPSCDLPPETALENAEAFLSAADLQSPPQ